MQAAARFGAVFAESVQDKLDAFAPLLKSISDLGSAIQRMTSSINDPPNSVMPLQVNGRRDRKEKLEELIEFLAFGILFWQQIKKRR